MKLISSLLLYSFLIPFFFVCGAGVTKAESKTNGLKQLKTQLIGSIGIYGYHERESTVAYCQTEFEHFDSRAWENLASSADRFYLFTLFLKDYDLIGMKQDDVLKLLSDPNHYQLKNYDGQYESITYVLRSAFPHSDQSWKIHLLHGKVDWWSFTHGKSHSAPVTTNVVVSATMARDEIGRNYEVWPKTYPKQEEKHR